MIASRALRVGVLVLLLSWAPLCRGQDDEVSPLERFTARAIARLALIDLSFQETPLEEDFVLASDLLGVAHAMDPADVELLRLLIEASGSAGRSDDVLELTRSVVRLAPGDEVAWLRLLNGSISRAQDVDERIEKYNTLLGPRGKGLTPAVRSRLALDVALLLRERGDLIGFADRLALATELDATNKEAAALALSFYDSSSNDPIGRVELLINLLIADPFDPRTHHVLSQELIDRGAFEGALRFQQTHLALLDRTGTPMTEEISAEGYIARWYTQGPERLTEEFRGYIEAQRELNERQRVALEEAGEPTDDVKSREEIRLGRELAVLRFAAAEAAGDAGQLRYASEEFNAGFVVEIRELNDPAIRPRDMTDDDVTRELLDVAETSAWMRLWMNVNPESAAQWLETIRPTATRSELAVWAGWLALRRGNLDEARAFFDVAGDGDVRSVLGRAVLAETEGDVERAVSLYEGIARNRFRTVVGAWSSSRYEKLSGRSLEQDETALALERMVSPSSLTGWVERLISSPRNVLTLRLLTDNPESSVFQEPELRVVLRNVSPIPLAVGPERSVNSRMLLVPRVEVGVERVAAMGEPVVLNLDQRLRLEPYGVMEATVRPTRAMLGWQLQDLSHRGVRFRWRLLQGFRMTAVGRFDAGPLSLTTESEAMYRSALARSRIDPESVARWISSGSQIDMAEGLIGMRSLGVQRGDEPGTTRLDNAQRAALVATIAERFRREDRLGRLLILSLAGGGADGFAALREACEVATDPDVQLVALATRTWPPDAPWPTSLTQSEDARVAELARIVLERAARGRQIEVPSIEER